MNLGGEDRKNVSPGAPVDVASPKTELDNLGIVKRWPVSKNACQLLALINEQRFPA
jgi:hypothetical protein